MTTTVYISIGNSDDRLRQSAWAGFVLDVNDAVSNAPGVRLHGDWYSSPFSPWQNACWCIEVNEQLHPGVLAELRVDLIDAAAKYGQTSIAWATADVEFLEPAR